MKATKKGAGNKKEEKVFFAIPEYQRWKEELDPAEKSKWRIKYYKGLGTNTTEEGKEYFKALGKHRIGFEWQGEQDGRQIDMAFSTDQVEQRKQWLLAFYEEQKQRVADHNYDVPLYSEDLFKKDEEARMISYSDFINKVCTHPALHSTPTLALCTNGYSRTYTCLYIFISPRRSLSCSRTRITSAAFRQSSMASSLVSARYEQTDTKTLVCCCWFFSFWSG